VLAPPTLALELEVRGRDAIKSQKSEFSQKVNNRKKRTRRGRISLISARKLRVALLSISKC